MAPGGRGTGNLPAELTSFVGRRGELAEVRRLLAGSRLVTLTGIGGVGKTRLALRAAAELRRAFRDGVWLVRLDQLRVTRRWWPRRWRGRWACRTGPGCPRRVLADYLAGRQLLLVLDNCEHLVDAAPSWSTCCCGRRRAAGAGHQPGITEHRRGDGAGGAAAARPGRGTPLTVAELARFPAVAVRRAGRRRRWRGFGHRGEHGGGGRDLPSAGGPAAGHRAGRGVDPGAVPPADRHPAGHRLGLLTRGSRTQPARQQTLRASIEWSYELCSEAERLLWARLSVFAGGFELDAVEGICADHRLAAGDVLELLAALADKSVLIADHGEGGARYRLPETLREYGQERLQESGEYTALRRRHRDWHEQLARQADTGWLSPQIADLDGPAVPGARQRAGGPGLLPGRARRGRGRAAHRAARMALLLRIAGYVSEGRYRLGQALARARAPTVWRAQGLLLASLLAAVSGDRDAAQPLLAQGTSLAGQLNDPATRAFAAYCAGMSRCSPATCRKPSPTTRTGWRPCPRPPSMLASAPSC